jgi:hypothetical protein
MREPRRTLVAAFCVVAGLSLVIFRLTSFLNISGVRATWVMTDFKTAIYYPVVAFLSGENPYAVERFMQLYPVDAGFPLYLPMTLLVHLPFGFLSPTQAFSAYFILTLVLTFSLGLVSLAFNGLTVRTTDVLLLGGLLLLTRPGHWNLLVGQPVLQLVLASYVAIYFAKRSPIISAFGLALSVVKPTFGIPIALLMLVQGQVRPVLYGATMSALINLPLVYVLSQRSGGIALFLEELLKNLQMQQHEQVADPALSIVRIDVTAFVSHFLGEPLSGAAQSVVFLGILGVASWILLKTAGIDDQRFGTLKTGIICLATLLSIHHQAYDLLLLTLPLVGLVYHRFPKEFYASFRYPISVGLFVLPAINYAATHSVMRFVQQGSGLWLFITSINGLLLLALFFLWVQSLNRETMSQPIEQMHKAVG